MKLFWFFKLSNNLLKRVFTICSTLFLLSCATNNVQTGKRLRVFKEVKIADSLKVAHRFYLIGDAGNATSTSAQHTLKLLESELKNTNEPSTLLFLGDNIYPKGLPSKENTPERTDAENKLKVQLEIAKKIKGKTIFMPGNHDWYNGIDGLHAQENFVTTYLKDKKSFLPRKGCPVEAIAISDAIGLIVIDSEWFLQDWDNHSKMNDDCEIQNRLEFFDELESLINKNQNKTTIIAMHHPLMSNGPHGGTFSFHKQLYPIKNKIPLPIIGSFINLLRKTSGVSPQDLQNKQYQYLVDIIKPMLQNKQNCIVVSGHEHNLQYIEKDGIKQIISGAGSKKEAARAIGKNDFSYGGYGFTVLDVYENGTVKAGFKSTEKEALVDLQTINVLSTEELKFPQVYEKISDTIIKATVYTSKMTDKSRLYKAIWGNHYRSYYQLPIATPIVYLDTLFGGLKPTISGGGHQSLSLRLKDSEGKEYVMRALKKNATRFLQSIAFRDQNVEVEFKNTIAEDVIFDFYTTAHPFTPFIIGDLASKIGVYHTNPKLYYIPKQNNLGVYNFKFGDELYLFEERPTDAHKALESFGKPDGIVGTDDVIKNIRKDEKYKVNEKEYLKARLFDMLIGDWDRHADQWRWAEYRHSDSNVNYSPIPRDRDQAFAKIDGALVKLLMNFPAMRHITNFGEKFPSEKWFNGAANNLDQTFLINTTEKDWIEQVKFITNGLTEEVIAETFQKLPKEINSDATTLEIKQKLTARKQELEDFALKYYAFLQKTITLTGTDKKDRFVLERLPEGKTKVSHYRMKKDGDELQFSRTYDERLTNEIRIYSLDDEDLFEIKGSEKTKIITRFIGGQNKDTYALTNGKKVKVYDYKSKPNLITTTDNKASVFFEDNYDLNEYHLERTKYSSTLTLPLIGFNPDDGLKLGASVTYLKQGFKKNPFTSKHNIKGNYYFATQGFEFYYNSTFAKVIKNWNLDLQARYTTPNFSINYFGYGNETINEDQIYGMDYNRVRIQIAQFAPSLNYIGRFGSLLTVLASFENIEVEETNNRYINKPGAINPEVFSYQQFSGIYLKYSYKNYDVESYPSMGMRFSLTGSWKTNLSDFDRNFPFIESELGFSHRITKNDKIVLGTLLKVKALLNNNFEFYQGATLGGDYDLRGFRNERFLGKQSFFQSTDLRWHIGNIRESIFPLKYGLLAGFDYGRVWLDGEDSQKWHQSVGGGIWLNGLSSLTARLTFFNSDDGNRMAFGLGFGF
jgi:predicted phosphodiesterase